MTTDQAAAFAIQQFQAGRIAEAESVCRKILAVAPDHEQTLHLLGAIEHQTNRSQQAVETIRRAVRAHPARAQGHLHLGVTLAAIGRSEEAAEALRAAVRLEPASADALYELAILEQQQQHFDEAIALYERFIAVRPNDARAFNNIGVIHQERGRHVEALAALQSAEKLSPESPAIQNNLGNALKGLGRLDEAVAAYQRALRVDPASPDAHFNLANVHMLRRDFPGAISSFNAVLRIQPGHLPATAGLADALVSHGVALAETGSVDAAVRSYEAALRLRPDDPLAMNNLASVLKETGRLDEAERLYLRAIELAPAVAVYRSNFAALLKDQGNVERAVDQYREATLMAPDDYPIRASLLYTLHFDPRLSPEQVLSEHAAWNAEVVARIPPRSAHGNSADPDRPLRVGYVSPNFRNHVVGLNILPLLRNHERTEFQAICYSDTRAADDITAQFQAHADRWHDTAGLSDEQLAEQIAADECDILIDLTLHMHGSRLLTLARRPAPVQVTFAGYPSTTGLSAMDYRLTDPHLDPPGNDRLYAEQSIRLPDSFWCYEALAMDLPVGEVPADRNGIVTFGCLNNFSKINRPVLELWARVLAGVPGSRLHLLSDPGHHHEPALSLLDAAGITPSRVRFFSKRPRANYLELYQQIDIALDTFPYNGHTTSLDAMWMGVPTVTLAGKHAVGRAGVSQLTNVGLTELIATHPDEFVQIATSLAGDLPRLTELRQALRPRMQRSPLMDGRRFARNIEAAYRTMWRRWCEQR